MRGKGDAVAAVLCLVVAGIGVGWMVGLSASPVVGSVLASILAVVVPVAAALTGLDATNASGARRLRVDPGPVTALVLGLVVGATIGVYARTHDWLAPEPGPVIARWEKAGLSRDEAAQRLLDNLYPPQGSAPGAEGPWNAETALLVPGKQPNISGVETKGKKSNPEAGSGAGGLPAHGGYELVAPIIVPREFPDALPVSRVTELQTAMRATGDPDLKVLSSSQDPAILEAAFDLYHRGTHRAPAAQGTGAR